MSYLRAMHDIARGLYTPIPTEAEEADKRREFTSEVMDGLTVVQVAEVLTEMQDDLAEMILANLDDESEVGHQVLRTLQHYAETVGWHGNKCVNERMAEWHESYSDETFRTLEERARDMRDDD